MVKRLFYTLITVVMVAFALDGADTYSIDLSGIKGLTPEARYEQEKLTKAIADSKYADAEIDRIHKRINTLLPYLEGIAVNGQNGEKVISLFIAQGEGYRWNGDKYLFISTIHFTVKDDKLTKVTLRYDRFNPSGGIFLKERRELENPTPFYADGNSADPNNDLTVIYYEASDSKLNYVEKGRFTFDEIDRHRDKTALLRVYKQYMRKSMVALETRVKNERSSKRAKMLYMIEFE